MEPELIQIASLTTKPEPKPSWLKARAPVGVEYHELKKLARGFGLHTVCESAHCPNIGECWNHRTATFLLLGDCCTRHCGFCAVAKGRPQPLDHDEPRRVGEAVARLGLKFAVITSVTRDDDNLGGAEIFAATIGEIKRRQPDCSVEVLIPDFQGREDCLRTVIAARPDVLNHNLETVPRLYAVARRGARYERSLELLARAKRIAPTMTTKSGIMVGLGEDMQELLATCRDLVAQQVDLLTIGQYLAPSRDHLPVKHMYPPEDFAYLRQEALKMGFRHVESAPLVRSSYHAHQQATSTHDRA